MSRPEPLAPCGLCGKLTVPDLAQLSVAQLERLAAAALVEVSRRLDCTVRQALVIGQTPAAALELLRRAGYPACTCGECVEAGVLLVRRCQPGELEAARKIVAIAEGSGYQP